MPRPSRWKCVEFGEFAEYCELETSRSEKWKKTINLLEQFFSLFFFVCRRYFCCQEFLVFLINFEQFLVAFTRVCWSSLESSCCNLNFKQPFPSTFLAALFKDHLKYARGYWQNLREFTLAVMWISWVEGLVGCEVWKSEATAGKSGKLQFVLPKISTFCSSRRNSKPAPNRLGPPASCEKRSDMNTQYVWWFENNGNYFGEIDSWFPICWIFKFIATKEHYLIGIYLLNT